MGEVLTPEYQADEIARFAETCVWGEGILTPFGQVAPEQLSQDGTLSMSVGIERTKNWLDAQQMRHLAFRVAHADLPPAIPEGRDHRPERRPGERRVSREEYARRSLEREIACANRWSTAMTSERITVATMLVTKLTATLELMESGALSYGYARALVEAVQCLDDPDGTLALQLEQRVLARAATQTYGEFRASIRRAVATLDPRDAEAKHARDAQDRRVVNEPAENAMCWLTAFLPAVDAATIMLAVQAVADLMKHAAQKTARETGVPDCRTADQYRADALTAICAAVLTGTPITGLGTLTDLADADAAGDGANEGAADAADALAVLLTRLPKWQGRRPNVNVTVSLATLLGLDDQAADLDGYGPIPADVARRIAADPTGTWHRLVTDDLGHLIDYGQTVYRPPQDLRDFVTARDRTCTGIGCTRSAQRCDLDHEQEYSQGGPTSAENLGPECEREHYLKQFAAWLSERLANHATEWTTPTGRIYEKPAHEYPLDQTRPKVRPKTVLPDDPPF